MPDARPVPSLVPPAPVVTAESRIEKFLEQNFKKIMLVLALFALLVATVLASRHFAALREQEAAEKFTAATGIEDCDVVIQKHPGTTAAGNALLLKSSLLWQQGKKSSSIDELQKFVKDYPSHKLLPATIIALGTKQNALGEKDAARATFEGFLKNYPESELAPAADIQLGDLLWQAGKNEEAKKQYNSLLQKYPGKMVMFNQAVDERLQIMDAGLPMKEVAGPPPPKPAPAPPANIPGITPMKAPEIKAPTLTPQGAPPAPAPEKPAAPDVAKPAAPAPATEKPVTPATPPAPAPAAEKPATPAPPPPSPEPVKPNP